jgi:hypothetical protein
MASKTEIPGVLVPRKTFIVHAGARVIRFLKGQTTIVAGHPLVSGREANFRPLTVDFDLPAPVVAPTPPEPEPTDEQKAAALAKYNRPELEAIATDAGIADPSSFANKGELAVAVVAALAAPATSVDPEPSSDTQQGSGDDAATDQTPAADVQS